MWELCEHTMLGEGTEWDYVPRVRPHLISVLPEMFIITLLQPLILEESKRRAKKKSWFMLPLLPFPVLIYENKIPANSSGINTRQLWGQTFSYTAQCKRLAVVHTMVMGCSVALRLSKKGALSAGSQSDLDSRHTSYLPAASFLFPAPINPPAAIKSTALTRPLSSTHRASWTPASVFLSFLVSYSTLNPNSPPSASASVFFTGKQEKGGESEDIRKGKGGK